MRSHILIKIMATGIPLTLSSLSMSDNTTTNNRVHSGWFPFQAQSVTGTSALGMQDWLHKPSHRLEEYGDKILVNGRVHKAWGTNVEYSLVAPPKKDAIQRTQFFAKYGINSIRLHKLTNPGWEGLGSTHSASDYDREKLARFDYWLYQLRNHGIRYGFSPIWDLKVLEGDRDKLFAYDEIINAAPHKPTTTGLVWFAEDVQQLHIKTITNLLNHRNPHTGLSYANDPALAYVEIQNEENAFFYTFIAKVTQYPSYHKMLAKQFSQWLTKKYQTHEQLIVAWGWRAINTFKHEGGLPNEHLESNNITPVINPWLYDNQAAKGYRAKRLQDTAAFLFEKQQDYYAKASKAIRLTGFRGPIVGSNWQAGSKGAHFLNLLTDSQVGIIDRHNYQGGAIGSPGHLMRTGFRFNNYTMLHDPGSGLLSVGMQQVANRPFMLSEWLAVLPSEWAAADTTILAAYGFGLQGWDMSYHFASNGHKFSEQLSPPGENKFNMLTPLGIGLYPVLSRMILRGDITEAEPIATRRISKTQALKNNYDFDNTVEQQQDTKSFSGTPHHHALAAGKVLVEFTEKPGISSISNWKKQYSQINADNSTTITSSTGELSWTFNKTSEQSSVKIDSQGTQGIVGFSQDTLHHLRDLSITSHSPYAVILTTAKSPTKTLATDKEALIVAIARAHNTGMQLSDTKIVDSGKAPILLEPVKATLNFSRRDGIIKVLNHDGVPTGKMYPFNNGTFDLDTSRDQTIYYLVQFDH